MYLLSLSVSFQIESWVSTEVLQSDRQKKSFILEALQGAPWGVV